MALIQHEITNDDKLVLDHLSKLLLMDKRGNLVKLHFYELIEKSESYKPWFGSPKTREKLYLLRYIFQHYDSRTMSIGTVSGENALRRFPISELITMRERFLRTRNQLKYFGLDLVKTKDYPI